MKSSVIEWLVIFVTVFILVICSTFITYRINLLMGRKSEPPHMYTVKTQTESYSGLKYDYSHEGRSIFFDKDNKKHVFSGNFQYIQE